MLNAAEVAKHGHRGSCWVIISGKVYDVTEFLPDHPGGASIILRYGGRVWHQSIDATEEYDPIHPKGTIEKSLPLEKHLGPIDPSTIPPRAAAAPSSSLQRADAVPLSLIMNLNDFESAAEKMVPPRAYAYFHSAADDLRSLRTNKLDWEKVSLRPRVLRNVARADMSCTMMGQRSRLPIFIAPAARARMANDDGELCLARGAARRGIPYCVSSYSSVAHEDLMKCVKEEKKGEGGCLFFQLYIQKTRDATEALISMARDLGFEALVVTVDTPIVGKREEDERFVAQVAVDAGEDLESSVATNPALSGENAPIVRGVHSATFNWDDLIWVRQVWGPKPMVLKGIQTAEDALLATRVGVEGIYLSNHGGRQIDDGPSSIRTLLEIHKFCPEVLQKIEIYLDGSVRRGTDVLKALCLGAKGIAIGRTFMYALGTHGTRGVEKAIQILSEEIECTMRLMGVNDLSQLSPEYLNYSILEREMPTHITAFRKQVGSKL